MGPGRNVIESSLAGEQRPLFRQGFQPFRTLRRSAMVNSLCQWCNKYNNGRQCWICMILCIVCYDFSIIVNVIVCACVIEWPVFFVCLCHTVIVLLNILWWRFFICIDLSLLIKSTCSKSIVLLYHSRYFGSVPLDALLFSNTTFFFPHFWACHFSWSYCQQKMLR